jgi:hypothetical protein
MVKLLIPVKRTDKEDEAAAWSKLDSLAAQIGARWPKGVSAAEAVSEGRR